jgi:hypothetical protein
MRCGHQGKVPRVDLSSCTGELQELDRHDLVRDNVEAAQVG